jgi:hypothetical protein
MAAMTAMTACLFLVLLNIFMTVMHISLTPPSVPVFPHHLLYTHTYCTVYITIWLQYKAQSRQSAKLFSSRRNWDSPNPSPAGECAPPPLWFRGEGTLAGERGGGRVPIPTRGHTLWYSVQYI